MDKTTGSMISVPMIDAVLKLALMGCALLMLSAAPPQAFERYLQSHWATQPAHAASDWLQHAEIESYYGDEESDVNAEEQEYATEYEPSPLEVEALQRMKPPVSQDQVWQESLYKVTPGDILLISIYDEEKSERVIEVSSSGTISYLFINALQVNGRTIPQLRQLLEERLKEYFKKPIVNVTLIEGTKRFVTVLGEVWNPGRIELLGDTTLLQVIAMAGGLRNREYRGGLVDTADFTHSFLARQGKYIPIDFRSLIVCGDTDEDIFLNPGDFVYISRAITNRVFVLGEVRGPTVLNSMDSITLVEALTAAGGLGPRASSRLIVIRGALNCPTRFLIDINRILKGYACDFPLCPGDIVYVPVRRFQRLREIIQSGISAFVSIVASIAGNEAFIALVPKALGQTQQLTPVINAGGTTSFNFSQSAAVSSSGL